MLRGQVALVTGASRGIGRGIALQLGEAGATVYITGRKPGESDAKSGSTLPTLEKTAQEITGRGGKGIAVHCDHSSSDDVQRLFQRIEDEQNGQLDILVNNAFAAVNFFAANAGKKFWEMDPSTAWDVVNNVGLRNHYICSAYAARLMVPRKKGLIVTVSSAGGLQYLFNVPYGVGKEACDRLAADTAVELRQHNITSVSLWPGPTRTEMFIDKLDKVGEPGNFEFDEALELKEMFTDGETTEYPGRAVVHLAADRNRIQKTGKILITSDLGDKYGFTDIDGRRPPNMRSMKYVLKFFRWKRTASIVPSCFKVPGWMMSASLTKL